MSTTTSGVRPRAAVGSTLARAVLAALLAVVTTFWPQPERSAVFGMAVLGAYLLGQAVVMGALERRLPDDRTGRRLTAVRAALSLLGGVAALAGIGDAAGLLIPVEAVSFLTIGAIELAGGIRRSRPETAGDAVVVGGLQAVVGLMLAIVDPDALFAIGVLNAWAAVVAVYLGIAAANLRRRGSPA